MLCGCTWLVGQDPLARPCSWLKVALDSVHASLCARSQRVGFTLCPESAAALSDASMPYLGAYSQTLEIRNLPPGSVPSVQAVVQAALAPPITTLFATAADAPAQLLAATGGTGSGSGKVTLIDPASVTPEQVTAALTAAGASRAPLIITPEALAAMPPAGSAALVEGLQQCLVDMTVLVASPSTTAASINVLVSQVVRRPRPPRLSLGALLPPGTQSNISAAAVVNPVQLARVLDAYSGQLRSLSAVNGATEAASATTSQGSLATALQWAISSCQKSALIVVAVGSPPESKWCLQRIPPTQAGKPAKPGVGLPYWPAVLACRTG